MRPLILFLAATIFVLSGCVDDTAPRSSSATRPILAAPRAAGIIAAPVNLEEYTYDAPNLTGAWGAALWLRAAAPRACDFQLSGTGKPAGGTWDSIGVVAKGWKRPELVGRFDHGFVRGDGYVAHVGTPALNQSLKGVSTIPPTLGFDYQRRVDLPTEALIVVGNTYMAPPTPDRPGLRVRIACDAEFQLVYVLETPRLLAYGPEDFSATANADTTYGFGAQRGATKNLHANEGFIVLLHEDGNQGNAEYTTTRPDSTTQVDSFGNRVVVGGPGTWRVGLNRISPSPQGEFRLFALDLAVPTFE